jgi:type II secretion system protein L
MRTRLFIRLHREVGVPGARCEWVLRDAHGTELRRGADTLDAAPKADEVIGVIAHDLVVTRAVGLPPGRRARTPAALANAMEPYLLSDPATNHVVELGEARDGTSVLAAIGRAWLDASLDACTSHAHKLRRLVAETSLPERTAGTWIAVCLAEGGFLRLDDDQAIALEAAGHAAVPEGVLWQAQQARASQRPLERMRVFHSGALEREAWRTVLGDVQFEDAGPWHWAGATANGGGFDWRRARDILPAVEHGRAKPKLDMRRWRLPVAFAMLLVAIHVAVSVVHWSLRAVERSRLQAEIATLFRRAVPPAEPLVDPLVQTRRALAAAQRSAGQYAADDFVALLARFAAETTGLPANSLKSVQYASGVLSAELTDVPAARLERLAQQLRGHGLKIEVSANGPHTRMTLRTEP